MKKKIRHKIFLCIMFASLVLCQTICNAEDTFVLVTVKGAVDTHAGVAIVKEAYRRLDMDVEIQWMQGKHALDAANSGKVDGEVQRIDGITRTFPNLIQVPIPVNYLQGVAFSKKYNFPIKGWLSLEPYRIGIVKGILFAEQGTQGMDVKLAKNYEELLDMLEDEEIDVAVMPRINGQVALKNYKTKGIRELEGILETLLLYHYLHEKHAELVPVLEKELKSMLLDGTTRRMRSDVHKKMLEKK